MQQVSTASCRAFVVTGTALALLGLTGCGVSGNKPYPVKGQVVFTDGQPAKELAGGTVTFGSEKSSSIGNIEADGNFRLTTFNKDDGALPGEYRVMVTAPEQQGGGDRERSRPAVQHVIDPRFEDLKTSGLKYTVEPKSNNFTIPVRRFGQARR